jgi:hypothetical protein
VNRRRRSSRPALAVLGALVAGIAAIVVPGAVDGGAAAAACRPFTEIKAAVHTAARHRETVLDQLVAALQPHTDPFSLNQAQTSTLLEAKDAVTKLDQTVSSTCYQSAAAIHDAVVPMFDQQRVYWLRVPQTHVIEAADFLAEATASLKSVAQSLAPLAKANPKAQSDLAAMNQSIANAMARIGGSPTPSASIAAVAALQPATDMTANDVAVNSARADLTAATASLESARDHGAVVVNDLRAG